jgi:hypothetical protein
MSSCCTVHTLCIKGTPFTPLVREPGTYTIIAFDPNGFYRKIWSDVQARRVKS